MASDLDLFGLKPSEAIVGCILVVVLFWLGAQPPTSTAILLSHNIQGCLNRRDGRLAARGKAHGRIALARCEPHRSEALSTFSGVVRETATHFQNKILSSALPSNQHDDHCLSWLKHNGLHQRLHLAYASCRVCHSLSRKSQIRQGSR